MDEHKRNDWVDVENSEIKYGNREELILEKLGEHYWRKQYEGNGEIFAGIVRTILSQNQNDAVSVPAADRMMEKFGNGNEMLDSLLEIDQDELAQIIHPCGPHNNKAKFIKSWASFVKEEFGDVEMLKWFVNYHDTDKVRDKLSSASGVGRKTLDVVLTFNAGKDGVFAVDTHVYRVAKRLAMVPEDVGRNTTAKILSESIPPEKCGWGHSVMINHGRDTCHAQNPNCEECILEEVCPKIGVDK